MSETAATQSKSALRSSDTADKQALAQVEKWLAVIREFSGERAKLQA
jgi:hypothetical protein